MADARALKAGLLYCAIIFAAGFVLGVARTLLVAPLAGEFVAVMLEAPVILAIAWSACGWACEQQEACPDFLDRLIMGGAALAALVLAEAAVAVLGESRSLVDYFESYGRSAVLLGLLAQLALAVFPILRRRQMG